MTNLVNLDRTVHQNLRVRDEVAFSACKDITMCAVTPTEVPRLVLEYPVVFTKHADTNHYLLVALFGVDPQKNLFWRDDRWQSLTVPLNVARHPFYVGVGNQTAQDQERPRLVTFIDLDNPGVQEADGEALFSTDGKESAYLQNKMAVLAELAEGEQRARLFTERLLALDLIRPIQIELKTPGAAPRLIGGLHSIDEPKLRALSAESLTDLNGRGYLHVIYAMLLSLGQLPILVRRAAS